MFSCHKIMLVQKSFTSLCSHIFSPFQNVLCIGSENFVDSCITTNGCEDTLLGNNIECFNDSGKPVANELSMDKELTPLELTKQNSVHRFDDATAQTESEIIFFKGSKNKNTTNIKNGKLPVSYQKICWFAYYKICLV